MESKFIQYIGKKAEKPDNVANTNLVWKGHGATLEVSSVHATMLLMHPDIWRDVTDQMKDGQAPSPSENAEGVQFQGGMGDQIIQAIQMMDETNPDHFDEDGYPSIAVIESILQYEIEPDELGIVMQDIRKARDESMGVVKPED